jgi:molybdate transport system substrate-binding protein
MRRYTFLFLILFLFVYSIPAGAAESINVAVSSNFMQPFKEIAKAFTTKTRVPVMGAVASSGYLIGEIMSGAPYDIVLAGDEERPAELFQKDLAEKPFVYTIGTVVLWTAKKDLCGVSGWQEVVKHPSVTAIGVAWPKNTQYGASSMYAIEKSRLLDTIKPKLIYAANSDQVFEYAFYGSVDVAFCALSSALSEEGKKGCYLEVKEAHPIIQAGCVLKPAKDREAVKKFVNFLNSPEAKSIKQKYGYR